MGAAAADSSVHGGAGGGFEYLAYGKERAKAYAALRKMVFSS